MQEAEPRIGITPPGALGVAIFHHLTRGGAEPGPGQVGFIRRESSSTTRFLMEADLLRVRYEDKLSEHPLDPLLLPGWDRDGYPEVLLVCSTPDQLFTIVDEYVRLLERLHASDRLDASASALPAVILCANGIYFQRIRQVLVEKIEEAELLGRLPDLWPDLMPAIVGHWMRGVTIQTGLREGTGARALYLPGPSGLTTIAGGLKPLRERVVTRLAKLGGWFEDAGTRTPTSVEFQKAIINLNGNLIGILASAAEGGSAGFKPLSVARVHAPERLPRMRELTHHVMQVGRAVNALGPDETLDAQIDRITRVAAALDNHVPSSVQWVEKHWREGSLKAEVPPTEAWLLNPLLHYARSTGLWEQVAYFEALQGELIDTLRALGASPPAP